MSIVVNKTRLPVTQWQTESGSVVSVADARKRYAKSLSVALEPIQDLHGYSNPWVGGAGKNLFDINKSTLSSGAYGFTMEKVGDSIRVHGTATASGGGAFAVTTNYSDYSLSGKGYVVQAFDVHGVTINNIYGFRTETEKAVAIQITRTAGVEYDFTFKISVSETSQTEWTPYENLCPISGHSSVTAVRDGKNLTPYADKGHSTRIWGTTWPAQLSLIKTLKPSQYTISAKYTILTNPNNEATVDMGMLLRWRDSGGTWHQIIPYQLTTVSAEVGTIHNYSKTFTLSEYDLSAPNLEFYLYCGTGTTATTANCYDCQIETGSATAYEPFQGTSVTVSLGQTVYGGTLDVVSGVMTVTHGDVDLGSLEWEMSNKNSSISQGIRIKAILDDAFGANPSAVANAVCSDYKILTGSQTFQGNTGLAIGNAVSEGGHARVQIFNSKYNDLTPFENSLDNVQLVYELATPITIQLSPNQIEMLMRNNTVWSDAGLVTLNYARIRQ